MRIGKHQLRLLVMLGTPTRAMVIQDRSARGMVRSGLLRELTPDGSACITSAGLRQLADEMDAGRVEDALEAMRKDVEARQRNGARQKAD